MITVMGFLSPGAANIISVKIETMASINNINVKGFINALKIFVSINSSLFFVIIFFPFSSRSSFALVFL